MTEQPGAHFGGLAGMVIVCELAGCHVVDEQVRTGSQGSNGRVESFPLSAPVVARRMRTVGRSASAVNQRVPGYETGLPVAASTAGRLA